MGCAPNFFYSIFFQLNDIWFNLSVLGEFVEMKISGRKCLKENSHVNVILDDSRVIPLIFWQCKCEVDIYTYIHSQN